MAKKAGVPPTSRRIFLSGLGSQAGRRLGSFVYKSPALRRKKTPTTAQYYAQQTLAVAARFVSLAQAWEYQTSKDLAGSSGYTWKDQLIAGFFGTALEFTDTDGVLWRGRRIVAEEIQTLLDSISAVPGAILVRTQTGWAALYLGSNEYVLTVNPDTSLPDWLPSQSGGGSGSAIASSVAFVPPLMNLRSSVTFALSYFGSRLLWLPKSTSLTSVNFFCTAAQATTKVTAAIYRATNGVAGALAAQGGQVTGVTQGINKFPIVYTTPADDWYYCGVQALTASFSVAASSSILDNYFFSSSGALPSTAPTGTYDSGASWNSMWLSTT